MYLTIDTSKSFNQPTEFQYWLSNNATKNKFTFPANVLSHKNIITTFFAYQNSVTFYYQYKENDNWSEQLSLLVTSEMIVSLCNSKDHNR